mmetsp:Transcript_20219/g.36026  ORF Transcript_20219/g.36026 Transcript_20219/m.36026 type:complete len:808 (-) Transcript_20219:171-2594(-)|eukprot:CAMPEP_0197654728 /NCGR_PEP_ID=MMETSP1338-20131121/39022_1 /TAXON_ID=43686 ORGANISM="Pelagodinium beii, Strain RCC1491" /NCGR_SAMPLE_ID=MMETSP1338 /ASSEMBLY_ACC=CAM_ASM_000754 /LENGTH=807 /DNA_ID=CAMNT_0043230223 /DNA_START=40 /DNA_END=2463 /DNA_ORIENTATION=-
MENELRAVFHQGLGKHPRAHQIKSVHRQLAAIQQDEGTRFLHQHAPGSGKTEIIALMSKELLRRGIFDFVVILNYATELEEQMLKRCLEFWQRTGAIAHRRAARIQDLQRPLEQGTVLFSLLQKFQDEKVEPAIGESPGRICVIIDEAHRGVPDEGVYIKNVLKRFGKDQTQIFFTATPKSETLLSHGLRLTGPHGDYYVAFDVHTQRDAVKEKYTLNPLEKYMNAAAQLTADGTNLIDLEGSVSMATFMDRIHKQRSNQMVLQQANFILDHLRDVHEEMPNMIVQGHQIKHLVVAQSQQAVHDLGEQLKKIAAKKKVKSSFGRPLVIGEFFSGSVRASGGKTIRDREANGNRDDADMLSESDIVVCCCKFLAGWDEWRLCSVFLCKRVFSEEFLQQMLARATRARPGTGKKRPLVFDLANHPDDVCAAVARFWLETRHFEGPLGEVIDLAEQIKTFSINAKPADVVTKLSGSDQILLRAFVVRYYRAAAPFTAAELPLSFDVLADLLRELNLVLCKQLFGGDRKIAKSEAELTASLRARALDTSSSASAKPVAKKTVPAALRHLRTALQLGRAKRGPRTDQVEETPAKRQKTEVLADISNQTDAAAQLAAEGPTSSPPKSDPSTAWVETPAKVEQVSKQASSTPDLAAIKAGLRQAVDDVAERYWNQLPEEGDADTQDTREAEMRAFKFAAYPLRQFSFQAVTAAEKTLRSKLTENLGTVMKNCWEKQRADLEQQFRARLRQLRDQRGPDPSEDLCAAAAAVAEDLSMELAEIVDQVGGRVAGWQKRSFRKSIEKLMPLQPASEAP